jgi:type VI secretion system ImpJ/VasE family protein
MHIHWHEGLFLQPHHLQRLQRNVMDSISNERKLAWEYPYGIIDMRVSVGDLESGKLRFDKLRALMPSGTEVNFPEDAEMAVVDIKEALEELGTFTVFLAIPLWFKSRANCLNSDESVGSQAKILYRVVESEWADENTGSNAKAMLERRINARLLIGDEDRKDMEVIPLFRITRSAGEDVGLPRLDSEFVGPCLVLKGSMILRELVRNLRGQIEASRQELIVQINRGGFSIDNVRGTQFEQMTRLQALNRSLVRLEALLDVPSVTPFQIYLDMRSLLADLCAMHPDRDLFETQPYNHDNPYPCFQEIIQKIGLFLRGAVAPNFLKVPFTPSGAVLQATLTEEHFTQPTCYFLGIRTREDPLALARFVENEDRFKLMPASMSDRAIRGILLKEDRQPPLELPAQTGLFYYRLQCEECAPVWNLIKQEKSAIVRWSGNDKADYQVTLYMPLANTQ